MRWPMASEARADVTVVRFHGHLGLELLAPAPDGLDARVRDALCRSCPRVLFEMSDVASVHPLVLARLARLASAAAESGRQVRWCASRPGICRLFRRIGLDERFHVFRSEDEALGDAAAPSS